MRKRIALIDNGSLRPAAVLALRRLADELGEAIGEPVSPVSMAHSNRISPDELGGRGAQLWREFVRAAAEEGTKSVIALPLFFGPSRAVAKSLPRQFEEERGDSPLSLRVAETLVREGFPEDDALARIMSGLVIEKLNTLSSDRPLPVALVDHGSPSGHVARCRDLVARQMATLLGKRVRSVTAASMERREGDEYAFNAPLLERLLGGPLEEGVAECLILSMMFLLPGRHAGPGGDIAEIVEKSEWARSGRTVVQTELVGSSPGLIDLLAARYRALD